MEKEIAGTTLQYFGDGGDLKPGYTATALDSKELIAGEVGDMLIRVNSDLLPDTKLNTIISIVFTDTPRPDIIYDYRVINHNPYRTFWRTVVQERKGEFIVSGDYFTSENPATAVMHYLHLIKNTPPSNASPLSSTYIRLEKVEVIGFELATLLDEMVVKKEGEN